MENHRVISELCSTKKCSLMIFGHGDDKNYGISIGGQGDPENAPRPMSVHLETLMRGLKISLTLLTTACYAGSWLVRPILNISGLSAADHKAQSHSWMASLGRSFHGSIWASAVMESLIKMEESEATQLQPGSSSMDVDRLGQNVKSSTFASLANVVATTLKTEVDSRGIHAISFAAQDDEWAKEWRDRSGIPLGRFEVQWDLLPRKTPQAAMEQLPGQTGGISSSENNHGFRKTLTRRQADSILANICHRYLNTFPPVPQTGDDILPYREAEHFLEHRSPAVSNRAKIQAMLSYRLDAADLATKFKDLTLTTENGQAFPPCLMFGWENWMETAAERSKLHAFEGMNERLRSIDLLDPPTVQLGYPFSRFYHSLAAAYAENDLDREAVDAAIAIMKAFKEAQVQMLTEHINYDRSMRNSAKAAFSTIG